MCTVNLRSGCTDLHRSRSCLEGGTSSQLETNHSTSSASTIVTSAYGACSKRGRVTVVLTALQRHQEHGECNELLPCCVAAGAAAPESTHEQQRQESTLTFRYHTNTCALEYYEPVQSLAEGSISSIHLVRRRPQRVEIPYQERADILAHASRYDQYYRCCD